MAEGEKALAFGSKRSKPPQLRPDQMHVDRLLDDALEDTFPASDPFSIRIEDGRDGGGARSTPEGDSRRSRI